mmetsp:Transcript_37306/g.54549  ORF Transcript_37306/g.54549 Transcript_37306/m.54549 type:complete len:301 (+) Transcript_37306:83-985(+)
MYHKSAPGRAFLLFDSSRIHFKKRCRLRCQNPNLLFFIVLLSLNSFTSILVHGQLCESLNQCSGHGTCIPSTDTCSCDPGWGSTSDLSYYKSPDCSLRTCPVDRAWGDIPTSSNTAHALAECSNRGTCNRHTGSCVCFDGFEGSACQRMKCPNDCSGHGQCLPVRQLATMTDALPLSDPATYTGFESTITWDSEMIYGCVCDSSWAVGLGNGERQEPEWFGADCSLRHCPSADDPRTTSVDETDCSNKDAKGGRGTGQPGNICHIDCSNRGLCDYVTGRCTCFDGYYGEACHLQSALAKY